MIVAKDQDEVFRANYITCPYCGYEWHDSWEASDVDDDHECGRCMKHFAYTRIVDVSYTSRKIEQKGTNE
jgi:hypothetical protein